MKKHLYESVSAITHMAYTACGVPCCGIAAPKCTWQYFFAKTKKQVTCENCKRTKLFQRVKK